MQNFILDDMGVYVENPIDSTRKVWEVKKKKEKVGYEMSIQKPTVFLYKGATEDEMVGWHYWLNG